MKTRLCFHHYLALAGAMTLLLTFFPGRAHAGYIFITEDPANVTIYGGDYEEGLQANGQDINTTFDADPYTGTPLTVSLGTAIDFSGELDDDGATMAGSQHLYVLPFAGANYAISDLSLSNTASDVDSFTYTITGTYNSGEDIPVPVGASTIVEGEIGNFSTPFSLNTLTVPEPSTWTLLGVSAAGVGFALRRRPTHVQTDTNARWSC